MGHINTTRISVEYTWSDSLSKKVKLPAPQYIDYMTTSIQNVLNDESVFPTKAGKNDFKVNSAYSPTKLNQSI